jgi:cytochrome c1
MSLETLTDPVLFNDDGVPVNGDYVAFAGSGGPKGSIIMVGPADQIASQLPWPPADIDEITAVDESDDPVHYHVSFDGRGTDPPAENSLLTWSVESTDYPLP